MIRESFPVGPLQCNCSIIGDPVTRRALVVDPGGNADYILSRLQALDLQVVAILHTHAHLDHFLAAGSIREATGAPLCLHPDDRPLWDALEMQCNMFGIPYEPQPDPDQVLHDDEELPCCSGVALHTPGHTPGSMSFWFADDKLLVAGDTLFRRSIGRTDLWGGDHQAIERSLRDRIYRLDEEALVVTGHGPETSIGEEIRENPFVRA